MQARSWRSRTWGFHLRGTAFSLPEDLADNIFAPLSGQYTQASAPAMTAGRGSLCGKVDGRRVAY